MSVSRRYTVAELEQIEPKDGERYEVINGELYVAHAPSWHHQYASSRVWRALDAWSEATRAGLAHEASGIIFNALDGVIPDVIWMSVERMAVGTDAAGHFTIAPELVVEVLSPGIGNERRDREVKLALYSAQDITEYWIVDIRQRAVLVYRRLGDRLALAVTASSGDTVESPLLPGFVLPVDRLWAPDWLR